MILKLHFTLQNETILCYQQTDEKASSGLKRKLTIKKFNSISELFRKLFLFIIVSFFTKRLVTFHIEVLLMTNLINSQMIPIEHNIRFQGIAHVFFVFDSEFSKFLMNFDLLFEILLNFGSPMLQIRYLKVQSAS